MSYSEDRSRIRYEERLRQEAREDIERERHNRRQGQINRLLKNERYVEEHGRAGAFQLTVAKWTAAGVVLAVIAFIGAIEDESFLEAFKGSFTMLIVFAGIGVWRGCGILKSVS